MQERTGLRGQGGGDEKWLDSECTVRVEPLRSKKGLHTLDVRKRRVKNDDIKF